MNNENKTCGTCQNWHDPQVNQQDVRQRTGECRALPPTASVLSIRGQPGIMCLGIYPRLNGETPACGMYAEARKVIVEE